MAVHRSLRMNRILLDKQKNALIFQDYHISLKNSAQNLEVYREWNKTIDDTATFSGFSNVVILQ